MLRALLARTLEPVDLTLDHATDVVGHDDLRQLPTVLRNRVVGVAVLTELLADRGELLAQQELALRLVHAFGHPVADLLRQVELDERLAHEGQRLLQARFGIEFLEQFHLALDRQVRRPPGGVGQRAGVVDAGQRLGDPRGAELLGDAAHHRPVLTHHLLRPARHLRTFGHRIGLDPEARVVTRDRAADHGPRQATEHQRPLAAGQLALVLDAGNGADPGVARVDPWHQEDPAVARQRAVGGVARASAVSSARVTTIWGRTTPVVRGSNGRLKASTSGLVSGIGGSSGSQ